MDSDTSQERTALILDLFNEAVDLPERERAAYLERACSGDPMLREEVDSLLRTSEHVDDILVQYEIPLRTRATDDLTGRLISHYEVLDKLGGGGMGEVYRAHDTRLGRIVALKFLPPHLSLDEEAKRRFIKEAKAASSLDHVNICTIYEIDETEPLSFGEKGRLFISMAFVEGESLKQRIARGPLDLDDATTLASQMAHGLAAAHARGIVHRDVKPANIMVARGPNTGPEVGMVKIVDFGVAKLSDKTTLTREGATMGTVAYMSPEQLRGDAVDARSDIWSLGAVLYEMVTGQQPFGGSNYESCAFAILKEEPAPLTGLRSGVPMPLEGVVSKCLTKDPGDRYQHAEEVAVDLRAVGKSVHPASTTHVVEPSGSRGTHKRRSWGIAFTALATGIVLTALVGLLWPWESGPENHATPIRFTVRLPEGEALFHTPTGGSWNQMAISPDGRYVVYNRIRVGDPLEEGSPWQLHLRDLSTLEDRPIPGTDQGTGPFFSPDGEWLGFFDVRARPFKMKKVSPRGGSPLTITEGESGGASWGQAGTIVFANSTVVGRKELWQTSSDGGGAEQLTDLMGSDTSGFNDTHQRWPDILPGGSAVLYARTGKNRRSAPATFEAMSIRVLDLETGVHKTLIDPGTFPRYAPTGHLVYAWAGNLLAAPFDLETLEVTGPAVVVQENVLVGWAGNAHFDFSKNGTLFFIPKSDEQYSPGLPYKVDACWVDLAGNEVATLPDEISPLFNARISPDGGSLAAHKPGATFSIWIHDLERGTGRPVSPNDALAFHPTWSPDGSGMAYSSNQGGGSILNLFLWSPEDNGTVRQLTDRSVDQQPQTWSVDGKKLIFTEPGATDFDILEIGIEEGSLVQPLVATAANEVHPVMSPNGRWLAYTSDVTGADDVFVRRYPESDYEVQASAGGGREPLWAPDGKTLYYRLFDAVMAVSAHDDGELRLGKPRLLFRGKYLLGKARRSYDISPDGSHFLMLRMTDASSPPTEFVVVVNWFEELKRIFEAR
jgi:serine/threonine protein kinase